MVPDPSIEIHPALTLGIGGESVRRTDLEVVNVGLVERILRRRAKVVRNSSRYLPGSSVSLPEHHPRCQILQRHRSRKVPLERELQLRPALPRIRWKQSKRDEYHQESEASVEMHIVSIIPGGWVKMKRMRADIKYSWPSR